MLFINVILDELRFYPNKDSYNPQTVCRGNAKCQIDSRYYILPVARFKQQGHILSDPSASEVIDKAAISISDNFGEFLYMRMFASAIIYSFEASLLVSKVLSKLVFELCN